MTIHKVNCIHYSHYSDVSPYPVIFKGKFEQYPVESYQTVKIIIEEMMLETVKPH